MFRRLALVVAATVALFGCARSCKNDHPYVPYAVDDAPAEGPSAASVPSSVADAGSAPLEPSMALPPATTTFREHGVALRAPSGRELAHVLVVDVDDDGKMDAFAVLRPSGNAGNDRADKAPPGELAFYSGVLAEDAPPTILASAPPLPIGARCTPVLRLERVGSKSAAAELGAACPSANAMRGVFVVRFAREPAITFNVLVRDPASAPKLTRFMSVCPIEFANW